MIECQLLGQGFRFTKGSFFAERLVCLTSYKGDAATLLKLFEDKIESGDEEDVLDFSPSFLVDFYQKTFYSLFPEPASFEEYVPSDWKGTYEDFTALIPETEKYWVNKDGENLFEL